MPSTTSHASHLSATYDVVLWIEVGVPASNVVMVLPLYGRTCFYPSPVVAARPKQHGSNATSVMSYAEVQKLDAGGRPTRRSWATSSGSCHRGLHSAAWAPRTLLCKVLLFDRISPNFVHFGEVRNEFYASHFEISPN
jgi:hypothetical protein